MSTVDEGLRDQVRDRYARAALTVTEVGATADCCGGGCGGGATVLDDEADAPFGAGLYGAGGDGGAAGGGGAGQPGLRQSAGGRRAAGG